MFCCFQGHVGRAGDVVVSRLVSFSLLEGGHGLLTPVLILLLSLGASKCGSSRRMRGHVALAVCDFSNQPNGERYKKSKCLTLLHGVFVTDVWEIIVAVITGVREFPARVAR